MKQLRKFLKTFFANPINVDGIIFDFVEIEIEKDFEDAFKFLVNVILPEPNQSYISAVLDEIIQKLIFDSFKFIGKTYSYSLEMTIDGKELFRETYTYIRKELLKNIMSEVNQKFSRVGFEVDFGHGAKNLNMDCRLSWDKHPYDSDDDNINFRMKVELSNFTYDGKKVIPNPDRLEQVAGTLWSTLADRDWFVPVIEEIIYNKISPETKIKDTEYVFAQVSFRVNRLNGTLIHQDETYWKVQPNDFIETT